MERNVRFFSEMHYITHTNFIPITMREIGHKGHFQILKCTKHQGPGWPKCLGNCFKLTCTDYCTLSPNRREFAPNFVPYKNGLRLTRIAHDKVCQLPAQWCGSLQITRLPPPGKLTAALLLKVALNQIKQTNQKLKYQFYTLLCLIQEIETVF